MGFVGEQNVNNHMGVRIKPPAEFQPATHFRRLKILNSLDMVWMQCCVCRLRRALRRADILHVLVRGFSARCQQRLHFPPHFALLDLQHVGLHSGGRGTFFFLVLMNTSEHTSVWDSQSMTCLPIFFISSSGLTLVNPIYEINTGVFFIGKRHAGDEFSLLTFHSTRWLLCWLSGALLAFYHKSIPTPARTRNIFSTAPSSATAAHRVHVCVTFLTQNWLWN